MSQIVTPHLNLVSCQESPLSKHTCEGRRPKKVWVTPQITIFPLKKAPGTGSGPLCDMHGSLSPGTVFS